MNAVPIRRALAQIGWWGLLVMVVVLLTFLFNILGTIICAVLTGMMMGAVRQWKWQALPISVIFPIVVVTLLSGPFASARAAVKSWDGNSSGNWGTGGLTKSGSGICQLAGSAANTCSGTTTVNQATLELNKALVIAVSGPLVISFIGC